jgi:hypothetical protein
MSLPNGTVEMFLMMLSSKLTQYDQKEFARETKRGHGNIYRLSLLLEAKNKVESDVGEFLTRDDSEAMEALRRSIGVRFHVTCPPVRRVLKAIEMWELKRSKPTLIG